MSFTDISIYDVQSKKYRYTKNNFLIHKGGTYTASSPHTETEIIQFTSKLNGQLGFYINQETRASNYTVYCENKVVASGLIDRNVFYIPPIDVSAGHLYRLTITSGNAAAKLSSVAITGETILNNEFYCPAHSCFD